MKSRRRSCSSSECSPRSAAAQFAGSGVCSSCNRVARKQIEHRARKWGSGARGGERHPGVEVAGPHKPFRGGPTEAQRPLIGFDRRSKEWRRLFTADQHAD